MIRVLIVDDNEMDRVLATHLLSDHYEFVYAADGLEGLKACESAEPDIVVTDLMMPNMDGMQMLVELHSRYPELPVIMMTSEGSESTAAEAIQRGAASYVPKAQLPERLKETVDQIVDLSRADRHYARLLQRMRFCRYIYELENDFSLIQPLVEFVQQVAFVQGICDQGSRRRVGVALEEALYNAMYHGNLELPAEQNQQVRSLFRDGQPIPIVQQKLQDPTFACRRVLVDVTTTFDEMRIAIEDDGAGFRHQGFGSDGTIAGQRDQHRGMVLMESIMDEVRFNESGNQITLVKYRDASFTPQPATV